MPIIAVECKHCGAKLKIKSGLARTPAEIKCPKCSKMIPLTKDAAPAPAAQPSGVQAAPDPAAPEAPAPPPPPAEPAPDPEPEAPAEPPPPPPVEAAPVPEPVQAPAPLPVTPPPAPEPVAVPAPVVAAPVEPPPVAAPPSAPAAPAAQATTSAPRKAAAPIVLSHLGEAHGSLSVSVRCPACHWQTKVREELVGKKIRCKQCGGIIPIVAEGGATAPAAVQDPAPAPLAPAPVDAPLPAAVPAAREPVPVVVPVPVTVAVPVVAPVPKLPSQTIALDALVQEVALLKTQLIELEGRKDDAVRRAEMAEKAFQELAGQRAMDEMNTRRKLAEGEAQSAALRALVSEIKADTQAELQAAMQRVAVLQQRLQRLG